MAKEHRAGRASSRQIKAGSPGSTSSELEQLQRAIDALEAQRSVLGDSVVEAALAPMREKLASLKVRQGASRTHLKYVTALFADVVGSTRMGEELDPEDTMAIMDGALHRFKAIIEQHGGRVLRFMGDGLKAVYGEQVGREDDAERAVRAGLALLEEARHYAGMVAERWQVHGFNLRVGINTGQVILGGGIEADNSAIGMAINLAARMETAAPPGGVLISQDTYWHVRGLFEVEALPLMTVKGKREPIQTYLVLKPKAFTFHTTARGVEGLETRMVGREAELKCLQDSFSTTLETSQTHLVTVAGEPGLGKTRLLYEFEGWVERQPQAVRIFRARATQQRMGVPYTLLRLFLTARFDILESDSAAEARRKLETGLAEWLPDEAQMKAHLIGALLGFDFPDSQHLRGVQHDPQQLRERALFYLAQFFSAAAQDEAVLLFLEDIHWADESSISAFQHLMRACPDLPMLCICLARPELFERYPAWGEASAIGGAIYTRLDLSPLSRPASGELVGEMLQKVASVPEELVDLVISRAEGNPFYLEELIRMLIEDGVIMKAPGKGVWRVDSQRLQGLRIPPTLTAVLQARFDSLEPDERTTLQQAAVVGRTFWGAAIQAIQGSGYPPSETLDALTRRGFVFLNDGSAFRWTSEFFFKHALMREVVYAQILKRERQAYHTRAADWLVEATQASGRVEEFNAVIAEHYAEAGAALKAADWFTQAGERAKDQGALAEAGIFFEKALEMVPVEDRERRWRALLGHGECMGLLGDNEARRADDESLLALAQELQDDSRLAEAYLRRMYYFSMVGDESKALEACEAGLAAARRAGDYNQEALLLGLQTASLTHTGDLEAAGVAAQEALARAQASKNETTQAMILTNVTIYYTAVGDLARAVKLMYQQLENFRRLRNYTGDTVTAANLGYTYVLLGMFKKGRGFLEEAIGVTIAIGARHLYAYHHLNLGLALLREGDMERALQALEKCHPILEELGDSFGQAACLSYLALVAEQRGDAAGAVQGFVEAEKRLAEMGMSGYALDALAGQARGFLEQGSLQEAKKRAAKVWATLQGQGSEGLEFPVMAYLTCTRVFKACGEAANARSAILAGYKDLMKRADKISEPAWRRSFLENIPEHRAIVSLRQELAS